MPKPRKEQIILQDTCYYHCVSRCVRRSFLCGVDDYSGKSYEHRRQWVENRLIFLTTVFSIDICAFAVMSNHTHIVLSVDRERAHSWTSVQVLERWHQLHKGTLLTKRFMSENLRASLSDAELKTVQETVEIYKKRLFDISWFMRSLNEFIARKANKEDECTGRFWEGRFKSQALLSEASLLACMIYVDRNPIRANLAKTPDSSQHTSIFHRIHSEKKRTQPSFLMPFLASANRQKLKELPMSFHDYSVLVHAAGKTEREDKNENTESPILSHLGINESHWLKLTSDFEKYFCSAVGSERDLRRLQQSRSLKRITGISAARKFLRSD